MEKVGWISSEKVMDGGSQLWVYFGREILGFGTS